MDLKYVILGFLDWKPLTGYELKSLFSDLDFLPWSGNNNQIYKSLIELEKEGLVKKQVIQQENYPAQKRYTVTEEGINNLRHAVLNKPDVPLVKNEFLLNLAWANRLSKQELLDLINRYQSEVETELLMCKEKIRRNEIRIGRNEREEYLWSMIWQNRSMFLQNELNWLTLLRNGLANK